MAHVGALKATEGAGICLIGGGELARSLFVAGHIDEVGLNDYPILLGSGIPMFPRSDFEVLLGLVETRQIAHGCVYIRYKVARAQYGHIRFWPPNPQTGRARSQTRP